MSEPLRCNMHHRRNLNAVCCNTLCSSPPCRGEADEGGWRGNCGGGDSAGAQGAEGARQARRAAVCHRDAVRVCRGRRASRPLGFAVWGANVEQLDQRCQLCAGVPSRQGRRRPRQEICRNCVVAAVSQTIHSKCGSGLSAADAWCRDATVLCGTLHCDKTYMNTCSTDHTDTMHTNLCAPFRGTH